MIWEVKLRDVMRDLFPHWFCARWLWFWSFQDFPVLSGGILLFSQSGGYVDGLHRGNERTVGIEPAAGAAFSYLSWNPWYIEYHKITRCRSENPSLGRSCLCFNAHHWLDWLKLHHGRKWQPCLLAWPFLELWNNTHSRARTLLEVSGKFRLRYVSIWIRWD